MDKNTFIFYDFNYQTKYMKKILSFLFTLKLVLKKLPKTLNSPKDLITFI